MNTSLQKVQQLVLTTLADARGASKEAAKVLSATKPIVAGFGYSESYLISLMDEARVVTAKKAVTALAEAAYKAVDKARGAEESATREAYNAWFSAEVASKIKDDTNDVTNPRRTVVEDKAQAATREKDAAKTAAEQAMAQAESARFWEKRVRELATASILTYDSWDTEKESAEAEGWRTKVELAWDTMADGRIDEERSTKSAEEAEAWRTKAILAAAVAAQAVAVSARAAYGDTQTRTLELRDAVQDEVCDKIEALKLVAAENVAKVKAAAARAKKASEQAGAATANPAAEVPQEVEEAAELSRLAQEAVGSAMQVLDLLNSAANELHKRLAIVEYAEQLESSARAAEELADDAERAAASAQGIMEKALNAAPPEAEESDSESESDDSG